MSRARETCLEDLRFLESDDLRREKYVLRRNTATRKEPDVDARASPLHRIDSSSDVVEVVTVGVWGRGCDTASRTCICRVTV
jgi:hypothetical protein